MLLRSSSICQKGNKLCKNVGRRKMVFFCPPFFAFLYGSYGSWSRESQRHRMPQTAHLSGVMASPQTHTHKHTETTHWNEIIWSRTWRKRSVDGGPATMWKWMNENEFVATGNHSLTHPFQFGVHVIFLFTSRHFRSLLSVNLFLFLVVNLALLEIKNEKKVNEETKTNISCWLNFYFTFDSRFIFIFLCRPGTLFCYVALWPKCI